MLTRRKLIGGLGLVGAWPLIPKVVSAPFTASKASTSTPSNFKVNATYDTSWTSVPAPPNVVNSLAAAIAILEGTFNLNFTLNIQFGYGTRNNQPMTSRLSQSLYDQTTIPYSTFRSALMVLATTTNSTTAANSLPASDPTGGATIYTSVQHAVVLGYATGSAQGYVGIATGNTYFYPYTAPVAGQYDATDIFIHEITETMGRYGIAGGPGGALGPLDLFAYSASGIRNFGPETAAPRYFSVNNGETKINDFWTANTSGDPGDWPGADSFMAFGTTGLTETFSTGDINVVDALGYRA